MSDVASVEEILLLIVDNTFYCRNLFVCLSCSWPLKAMYSK